MRSDDVYKPAIPLAYVQLIIDVSKRHGVSREQLLQGLGLPRSLLNSPDSRLSRHDAGTILLRSIKLTGNLGIGFEIGLESGVSTHGLVGYGLMSAPTLRAGIAFGTRFLPTRLPYLRLELHEEGRHAAVTVEQTMDLGPLQTHTLDLFLVGLYRLLLQACFGLVKESDVELWFDYAQPTYSALYRDRLPQMRFGKPANQFRFPAAILDIPLVTANPITIAQITAQLEQELAVLSQTEDLLARIRAVLINRNGSYPGFEEAAKKLNLSARTLRRKLADRGVSFRKILDDVLRRDAITLLTESNMSVEQIAERLGYADPANFTRAFYRWTHISPSAYRSARLER